MTYTTEKRLRAEMLHKAANAPTLPQTAVMNRWMDAVVRRAKRDRMLLTERQFADWKARRGFVIGDAAKFVGTSRDEPVGDTVYTRTFGQVGTITEVNQGPSGTQIVTFRPKVAQVAQVAQDTAAAEAEPIVELVVREGTHGYWDLERIP